MVENLVKYYDWSNKGAIENARQRTNEAKLLSAQSDAKTRRVDKVAKEFESLFLTQMLEHMFTDEATSDLWGGGQSGEVYRSFMLDEYGKLISKTGGIGIADHVKRELMRLQEVY